ncbi:actin-binding Rho-activating protein isoform X4 [Octodon degus]|uniref:Actin-binding Rho-activating protein n=1 Tax=Octodon degus TaxID=10160 RepID=A0A6P6DD93_OCTDE|nr:actin-binding Rho-activating protein isoform X4 [Octodon degus]
MAPGEKEQAEGPAKRALRKVRTATLVINLAQGWQQWASENSTRQAQEPPGWVPGGTQDEAAAPRPAVHPTALQDAQRATKSQPPKPEGNKNAHGSEEATEASRIKRKEVTKSVVSKAYERGGDVSALGHRRKCAHLVSELSRGWKELCQETPTWKSDSVDTEDSGYSEAEERPEQEAAPVATTRIKRPLASQAGRYTEQLSCKAHRKLSQVGCLAGRWQQWAEQHIQTQKLNPFSEEFDYELAMATRLHRGDEGYGRPKEGTRTAERAERAQQHIHREIMELCLVIRTMARHQRDGRVQVTFGELFDRYVRISDKVVGILLRARKHGLVHFEGEMLWQGRDDHVVITLLQ